jgi:prolyl-tRNA synthetase
MSKQGKKNKSDEDKDSLGITVSKEGDLSEWYTQVVLKAELADYTSAKGFTVLRPYGYEIWEQIKNFFDSTIKKTGHRNAYFPTLIPESLLKREAEHFAGFTPEVFWVTKSGNDDLSEIFAVRPTSETIIHDSMSRWIRSWRDLPMLLNVWNSVLRAEIKSTKPFIRSAEFLWQEGHTAHATETEAEKEVLDILAEYKRVMEYLLAIPVISGKKSEKEKFVGAVYTTTLESMMPDGRAVQMGTSHHLGQNFSKPFEIRFLGEDSGMHFVWQTSWGISWRIIGAMIMEHGDDKGLVVPPRVAPLQVVIVPIVFSSAKADEVLAKSIEIQKLLERTGVRVHLDSRERYTPGWKFNEWELKGIPLRVEIGPRDLASNTLVLVRRDTGEKQSVPMDSIAESVAKILDEIQDTLWQKALARLKDQTRSESDLLSMSRIIEEKGGFVEVNWCGSRQCEDAIKEKTGADIRAIPFEQNLIGKERCIVCNNQASSLVYVARAY